MKKYISILLKIIVISFATIGIILSMKSGNDSFMGGTRVLMYFTIQSNIAIALICLVGLILHLNKKNIPKWWYTIKFVGTVSITLTGVVFCFILAPTMGKLAWGLVNVFTHVIVPIAAILDFLIIGTDSNIKRKEVIYTIIPPILYLVYASVGYVLKWEFADGINYPYFFLDWGSKARAFGVTKDLPFLGCVWWIIILLLFIIITGFIYLIIIDLLKKTKDNTIKQ